MVEDSDRADAQVVAIGDVRIAHGTYVYADPAVRGFPIASGDR